VTTDHNRYDSALGRIVQQSLNDSLRGMAITERVDRLCHRLMGFGVIQQLACLRDDFLCVRSNKACRPRLNSLRAFRHPAQDEHRRAKRRRLLLESAGIGEHQVSSFHKMGHQ